MLEQKRPLKCQTCAVDDMTGLGVCLTVYWHLTYYFHPSALLV